jgi:hypothetical protein
MAHIVSGYRRFVGKCLVIQPLRAKLKTIRGNISEREVIALAEELYAEYHDRYKNRKAEWDAIRFGNYALHSETQAYMGNLKTLINKYREAID